MKTNNNPEDPQITSGKNISYWINTFVPAQLVPLKENLETEVVIVGGGLAGLSIAYCLTQSGRKVILVEDGFIGSGETGRTTAHLVTALDDRYYHLEKIFGEIDTKLLAESHRSAIDFVEKTVKKENIDCEFERVKGYLLRHPSDKKDSLEREHKAASRAGIKVEKVNAVPGWSKSEKALCFHDQAQFQPLRYLDGLSTAIKNAGGKIYTGTHASKINQEGITTSDGFIIKAKHIVVATNSPVNNRFKLYGKQKAFRTYVIGALVQKGLIPKALWWDTGDFKKNAKVPPYHYIRVQPYNEQYDLLISGGEDHHTGEAAKTKVKEESRYKLVEKWTRKHFPIGEVVYRWSGQVMEPEDGIALIGHDPSDHENIYVVTGDSGNGMTHCTIAGILISDLVNGKKNRWEKLYSPWRLAPKEKGTEEEAIAMRMQKILRKAFHSKNRKLVALKNGKAITLKLGKKKCGAYRDEAGKLFLVSTECTHLHCDVSWNNDEKSWDCSCHGSRFTYEGKVINGPANYNLAAYSEKENVQPIRTKVSAKTLREKIKKLTIA
jgi:glycine/D-amino acid oxidase-like deaminating enzyme/nitrite reductase/ring-hydroxylating ferredoxin subunit